MSEPELYAVHAGRPHRLELAGEGGLDAAYARVPHGVYEALRTRGGDRLFRLERHLARAQAGTQTRDLPGWDEGAVREALARITRAGAPDRKLRIDFLAGPASALGTDATVLIGAWPLVLPPAEVYRDGVGVQPLRDLAREQPGVKGAAYAARRSAHSWDERDNYEPILTDEEGRLLEGVSSNLFTFLDEPGGPVMRTARAGPDDAAALPGITREAVIELVEERGWRVDPRAVSVDKVGMLAEACLTSSIRGMIPVVRIADQSVGNGARGPRVSELMAALEERAEAEARAPLA